MTTAPAPRRGTSGRTVVLIFVIGGLVAVLSLVGSAFYGRTSNQVSVATSKTSYTDTSATITFEVRKRAQDAAVCSVQALDFQFTVVGSVDDIQVPAGATTQTVTTTVPTSAKANVVQVKDCTRVTSRRPPGLSHGPDGGTIAGCAGAARRCAQPATGGPRLRAAVGRDRPRWTRSAR